MASRISMFLELIRFSHTVFALPFALLTACVAWIGTATSDPVQFRWQHLTGILLCMVFARAAAMAFNRIIDRKIDAENPRTAKRHIPAGLMSVQAVVVFTAICSAGFIASTLLFLPNPWPIILSVPVLLFLLSYSYAKRVTSLAHYWLGAALMLSPIATWIALTGRVDWPPVLLGLVILFWVGGFDIIYACQDIATDRKLALRSIPARLGERSALRIAFVSHLLMLICLFAFWWVSGLGVVFLAGAVLVTALILYEHRIVRPDDLSRVNVAFFNVNAVVSLGLLAVGLVDLLL
jgi:4-hydroxybenzoate polyprenyltransferase